MVGYSRRLGLACAFWVLSLAVDELDFLSALKLRRGLSEFSSLISTHPVLVHAVDAGNVTVLAPTNEAFDFFFRSQTGAANYSMWDEIEALLSYHIVKGVHSRGFVTQEPEFLHTFLTYSRYSNVSDGQVVGVALNEDGACVFRAAVNCEARRVANESDLVFLGGVVRVIDTVLVSPASSHTWKWTF